MIYDAIVIGAGLIGTSCAYYIAKRGLKVLVLEKSKDLLRGSAGATGGFLIHLTKKPGYHLKLGRESSNMFPELIGELEGLTGIDIEYEHNCGGYLICETDVEYEITASLCRMQQEDGLDVSMIDNAELRSLEPAMSGHLAGASYSKECSKINTIRLIRAFKEGSQLYGAEYRYDESAIALEMKGTRAVGVKTSKGTYSSNYTINCTGAWSKEFCQNIKIKCPVTARKGQVVVVESSAPLVRGVLSSARFLAVKFFPDLLKNFDEVTRNLGVGFSCEQTQGGTFLIGYTNEFSGFDDSTSLEAIEALISLACRFIPAMREMHCIRTFSGLRPYTPDGYPLMGATKYIENFLFATGHESGGVALAPITGLIMSQMICHESKFDIEPLMPDRMIEIEA